MRGNERVGPFVRLPDKDRVIAEGQATCRCRCGLLGSRGGGYVTSD